MPMPDFFGQIGVVQISPSAPKIGIDGDLWYDTSTGTLNVSKDGQWIAAGGGGGNQVEVGDVQPTNTSVLIWIDTSNSEVDVWYNIGDGTGANWVRGLDGGAY